MPSGTVTITLIIGAALRAHTRAQTQTHAEPQTIAQTRLRKTEA